MTKECDNRSVGVIINNSDGEIVLLKRARFPVGYAPPAGHVDDHGSAEQAAVDEVEEEVGLHISLGGLVATVIQERTVQNTCRRPGGDHHVWDVFMTEEFDGELTPNFDEAKTADWYDEAQLQELAQRTRAYQAGEIDEAEWEKNPGLEEIWLDFLTELDYVE